MPRCVSRRAGRTFRQVGREQLHEDRVLVDTLYLAPRVRPAAANETADLREDGGVLDRISTSER